MTIVDEFGQELDMGTVFDHFGDAAFPEYYEKEPKTEKELEIRQNRRLLYYSMIDAGFIPDSVEWWHFNYGNSAWSNWTGIAPIYGGFLRYKKNGYKKARQLPRFFTLHCCGFFAMVLRSARCAPRSKRESHRLPFA